MKVLINIPKKIYKHIKRPAGYITGNTTQDEALKSIVDGTPIPDNSTNGDMIKAMFPTMEIEECNKDVNGNPDIYRIYGLSGVAHFGREFWNAPYKRGDLDGI